MRLLIVFGCNHLIFGCNHLVFGCNHLELVLLYLSGSPVFIWFLCICLVLLYFSDYSVPVFSPGFVWFLFICLVLLLCLVPLYMSGSPEFVWLLYFWLNFLVYTKTTFYRNYIFYIIKNFAHVYTFISDKTAWPN